MKRFIGSMALVLSAVQAVSASGFEQTQWQQVLNSEHRSDKHAMRDSYRHPYQTLTFFDVQADDHVVEIWPGGAGWYTEILAPLLREKGKLTAAHFSADSSVGYFVSSRQKYMDKLDAFPKVYDQVAISTLQPPKYLQLTGPGSADKVLTFRNVHNWMKSGHAEEVFAAMFAALKPGGVLGVVEHRAKPDTALDDMIRSGYVTEEYVKQLAERHGFQLVAESEMNANIKDSTLYPKGVWTLPPSLRLGEADRSHYLAIGESDRMTLKFIKPKL